MLFYKVVEIKQKSFMHGMMRASDLEGAINQWANRGWTLDRITSAETQAFLHAKDVFLLIFKREVEVPEGFHLMLKAGPSGPLTTADFNYIKQTQMVTPQTPAIKQGMPDWRPLFEVAPELTDLVYNG